MPQEVKSEEEALKLLHDKQWRLSHLYKIIDKKKHLINFERNAVQQWFADHCGLRNIVLKGRQLGFTTDACIDGLDDVLFTPNFTMVIIAHERDALEKIFRKVKIAWDSFPQEIKSYSRLKANTKTSNELSFSGTNSIIRVALSSRSDTVNRLHVSELAKLSRKYPEKAQEVITGSFESVPDDGRIDVESTSEGPIGHYHEMYMNAWQRPPRSPLDFRAFFFPWTDNPKYVRSIENLELPPEILVYMRRHKLSFNQAAWYWLKKQTLGERMRYEYPTTPEEAFQAGSDMMFDPDALDQFVIRAPESITGDWKYYYEYEPGHTYAMGVDVAEGIGRDNSAIVIWDFSLQRPRVVATYLSNRISPSNLAYEVRTGGRAYGMALAGVERNNHGYATLTKLAEIYPEEMIFRIEDEAKSSEKLLANDVTRLGWHTNLATKPKMLYNLRDAIQDKSGSLVDICDATFITDMRSYPKEDIGRTRPIDGQTAHWDMLMAGAIGFQMKNHIKNYKEDDVITVVKPGSNR